MTISPAPAPTAAEQPPRKGARINAAGEVLGFACLVAFAYLVWPPAALATAGVILIVTCNLRAAAAAPKRERILDRVARAIAAYRGGR